MVNVDLLVDVRVDVRKFSLWGRTLLWRAFVRSESVIEALKMLQAAEALEVLEALKTLDVKLGLELFERLFNVCRRRGETS
jgi:hypothetical protein